MLGFVVIMWIGPCALPLLPQTPHVHLALLLQGISPRNTNVCPGASPISIGKRINLLMFGVTLHVFTVNI